MPTPFPSRQAAPTSWTGAATTKPTTSNAEWRCTRCDKLLGVCRDGRMHLRFARGREYFVGFPVQATCRGCGTLNEISAPSEIMAAPPELAESR
jgi:phage FluMu protein Com